MPPISDSDVIAACHPATLPLKLVKTKQGIPAGVRYCNLIPIGDTHSGIGICLSHSVQHQLVRVDSVQPDGVAAAGGLLPGDIIWSIAEIWLPGGVPGTVMEAPDFAKLHVPRAARKSASKCVCGPTVHGRNRSPVGSPPHGSRRSDAQRTLFAVEPSSNGGRNLTAPLFGAAAFGDVTAAP